MRESAGVRFGLMGRGEKVELCLCFLYDVCALALVMFVEGLMVFCCCWMVWLPENGEKLIWGCCCVSFLWVDDDDDVLQSFLCFVEFLDLI
jgi:hypothetical protein